MSNRELLFSLPDFSKAMKAEIERTDWKFSDFETAVLIYNWSLPYEKTAKNNLKNQADKTELLKQIAFVTTDLNLKTQINQRITVDNLLLEKFKETNPKCVFVVQYPDNSIHGIYREYATALQNAADMKDDFTEEELLSWKEDFFNNKFKEEKRIKKWNALEKDLREKEDWSEEEIQNFKESFFSKKKEKTDNDPEN